MYHKSKKFISKCYMFPYTFRCTLSHNKSYISGPIRIINLNGKHINDTNVYENVYIGKYSVINKGVSLQYNTEKRNIDNDKIKSVAIGHDVYIDENVTLLDGVTVNNGCVIGKNNYINYDVPCYSIVMNNKVVGYRYSSEVIDMLQDIQWWNWSSEQLETNKWFFKLSLYKKYTKEGIENLLLKLKSKD